MMCLYSTLLNLKTMINPLKRLIKKATEYAKNREIKEYQPYIEPDGVTITYKYEVANKYWVTLKLKKVVTNKDNINRIRDRVQYTKEFSCTCTHSSLFGHINNIPCSHIYAVIIHLGLKELIHSKEVNNERRTKNTQPN